MPFAHLFSVTLAAAIDIKSSVAPRIEPAFQRAHAREAQVHQLAGDTRRAGFVGSITVDDDVAIGRQIRQLCVELVHVDRD